MSQSKSGQSITRQIILNALGVIVGLFFGVPPALGASSLGVPWFPYCIAVLIIGITAGLLFAFVVTGIHLCDLPNIRSSIIPRATIPPVVHSEEIHRPENTDLPPSPTCLRLEREIAWLEHLTKQQRRPGNSGFGKAAEQRIVWGELLDLELEDIDEQLHDIVIQAGQHDSPRSSETHDDVH